MELFKNCPNCNEKLFIEENSLFFSEEKVKEEAFCPFCNQLVYEGQTDGWFTVTSYQHESLKPTEECTYPMP